MNHKISRLILFFGTMLLIAACNENAKIVDNSTDSFTSGTYKFVFDESLYPLLDQEMYVFKSTFTDAKPEVTYSPENKILDLILNNKSRFAVMGRTLDTSEINILKNRNLPPRIGKVAVDAIALIVAKNSADSTMLLSDVKGLFEDKSNKTAKNLVFDNANSSVLNYLKKLSGTTNIKQRNIYALKNSIEVIKYVSTHTDAIGFLSYSWLLEPDKDYQAAVNNISVVAVKDNNSGKNYFKPSQSTIALKQYPLRRNVYVVDCTGKVGLGTGFAAFLQSERGQKIVLRSGLLPDSLPGREINIKTDL